jgi:hypothetical protein
LRLIGEYGRLVSAGVLDRNSILFKDWVKDRIAQNNHKVISVERTGTTELVYDLNVDRHHNFAIKQGVFVHNCHSTHGTRGQVFPLEGKLTTSKYLRSPFEVTVDKTTVLNRFGVKQKPGYGDTCETMNHVLLAACMSYQTAADAEFDGRPNGAWSWALLKSLRDASEASTNHDLHRNASLLVKAEGFTQKPCIEGQRLLCDRLFLGG